MSEKFLKGFSLEDYKLQLQVSSLEKEKQQCLNRLSEEQHLFKMSSRLHLKHGDDYWRQYGENYHANGDKRERGSFTCVLTLKNDQRRAEDRESGNYSITEVKMAEQSRTSSESESVSVKTTTERMKLIRDRREIDSRRKGSKSVGPTLLEILCGDFDCGILSLKAGCQYGSEFGKDSRNYSKHDSNGRGLVDKGLCQRDGQTRLSNAESSLLEINGSSGTVAKPKSASVELTEDRETFFANWCSNSELKSHDVKLSLNYFPEGIFGGTPGSLKPQKGVKTFQPAQSSRSGGWCKEHRKEEKETEKKSKAFLKGEDVEFQTRPEVDTLIRRKVLDHCDSKKIPEQELKTPEQINSPETMESTVSLEINGAKSRKADSAADKSHGDETCKTGCTSLSNSVNSRNNGAVKSLHLRKSQDDIDKEMRNKMDQFFAKVELTKNYQSKNERWRCNCSGRNNESQIKDKQTRVEQKTSHYTSNNQGYRRAVPWPTEVWS